MVDDLETHVREAPLYDIHEHHMPETLGDPTFVDTLGDRHQVALKSALAYDRDLHTR